MTVRHLVPCMMIAICVSATAQEHSVDPTSVLNETPLQRHAYGGLVTNQTMTVAGYEFYRYFAAAWREKDTGERYSLSIHERPSARYGTKVWVEFRNRRIFQASLPTSRSAIRSISEQAAGISYETIVDMDVHQALFRNPDLAMDELRN